MYPQNIKITNYNLKVKNSVTPYKSEIWNY